MFEPDYIPERAEIEPVNDSKVFLSQNIYETLRWLMQYFVPGLGTLYFALSVTWGLPYGEQIVGTSVAVTSFLGVILGVSKSSYINNDADGVLNVTTSDEKDTYSMVFNGPLEDIRAQKLVTFKVVETR